MKIHLESTDKIVEINGVPARIWEGESEAGVKCHAFITQIAVHNDEDQSQFDGELQEGHLRASPDVQAYDARLFIG